MKAVLDKNMKFTLLECFGTDDDLLNKFHIESPASLSSCVNRTFEDLSSADNLQFLKVVEDEITIGWFGTEEVNGVSFLTGFFLKPEYRKRKDDFFSLINSMFDGEYFTAVYKKNERAISYLSKIGEPTEAKDIIIFKINPN